MQNRFWQIDAARGLAVVGMVIYHFLVDVEMIFQIPIGVDKMPLVIFARIVAMVFILLVGVAAVIKFERIKDKGVKKVILSFVKRAGIILFWAGIISLVTYALFPNEFIFFGILHFMGVSMILIIPFLWVRNNFWLILAGILFFGLDRIVPDIKIASLDYFPLVPWFGVIILGVVLGRIIKFKNKENINNANYLVKMGQNSLLIYLIHQPVLWSILWVVDRIII